jgi:hypothetical protein
MAQIYSTRTSMWDLILVAYQRLDGSRPLRRGGGLNSGEVHFLRHGFWPGLAQNGEELAGSYVGSKHLGRQRLQLVMAAQLLRARVTTVARYGGPRAPRG